MCKPKNLLEGVLTVLGSLGLLRGALGHSLAPLPIPNLGPTWPFLTYPLRSPGQLVA